VASKLAFQLPIPTATKPGHPLKGIAGYVSFAAAFGSFLWSLQNQRKAKPYPAAA